MFEYIQGLLITILMFALAAVCWIAPIHFWWTPFRKRRQAAAKRSDGQP